MIFIELGQIEVVNVFCWIECEAFEKEDDGRKKAFTSMLKKNVVDVEI